VFKKDLLGHLAIARRWLTANAQHEAVKLVVDDLYKMLSDAAMYPVTRKPRRTEWQLVMRVELTRLHRQKVTGLDMLEMALALWMWSHARKHVLAPLSREFNFALTRLVLGLRVKEKSERRGVQEGYRLPIKVREHVGHTIVQKSHLLLRSICTAMAAQAKEPERRVATLAAALAASPFEPPSTPPTTTTTTSGAAASDNPTISNTKKDHIHV
jgi:hypothetical protein